jgi:hypothetical protein
MINKSGRLVRHAREYLLFEPLDATAHELIEAGATVADFLNSTDLGLPPTTIAAALKNLRI